ncbi:MAG: glycoside hydrolase family 3 C-terminal domain-containing protein, partial [Anaerolineae bacterium]|nr:glycoside hydrolase family 3 C-terminal domain-containing protein [Anaerolineae bacterium]
DAGAVNIMVSFSSWNGLKMHAHEYLLNQVLKGEWGFNGFLVSDWMAVNHISDNVYDAFVTGINAGIDMVMVPFDYKGFITNMTDAVNNGDIAMERIDDAVTRILRAKFMLGLFDKPITDEAHIATVGGDDHRALAREAVHKSLVLLKHDNHALPLDEKRNIGLAGLGANDIGLACGGWTIIWQGSTGPITAGKTLLDGLEAQLGDIAYSATGDFDQKVDTAVVVVSEVPYAEGEGDRENLVLSPEDEALIAKVRARCDKLVLVIYSGRPLIITHIVDQCDAIVAAWLPGSEADAVADVLTGRVPFTGKLSYTWFASMSQLPLSHLLDSGEKPLFPYGHGLTL